MGKRNSTFPFSSIPKARKCCLQRKSISRITGRTRIVDYKAKWAPLILCLSPSPRSFDFGPEDRELPESLKKLASGCWTVFGLSGYARVDFRVDEKGNPWILEVNANPCISPDTGFAAALEQAGIPFAEAVRRILENI